ncbi:MAG: ABC transporter permease, partial [Desulfobacterales bacterium]|nr:ABC transporter permease [Desulfobacterales bacterium]
VTLIVSILVIAFPVIFAFLTSTHTFQESFAFPPKFHIGGNIPHNYATAWKRIDMGRLLFNSAFISVTVSFGKIALSLLAAFAFTYFGEFRGKYLFFVLILI